MGGWLLLVLANWAAGCLTGCCAPLQLLLHPSLLPRCPRSAHPQDDKESWALLLPPLCCENALSLQDLSTLPAAAWMFSLPSTRSSLASVFIIVQFLLLYKTWPLQCDIPTCHLWERLPRQLWTLPVFHPPTVAHSLSLPFIFSPLHWCASLSRHCTEFTLFFPPTVVALTQRVCLCTVLYVHACVCVSVLKRREILWDSETGQSINSIWRERRIDINKQSRNITLMCSEDFISIWVFDMCMCVTFFPRLRKVLQAPAAEKQRKNLAVTV